MDLAKAFDSVNVDLLFHKLQHMGINQQIFNWLREYFRGRQQIDLQTIVNIQGGMPPNILDFMRQISVYTTKKFNKIF